VAEIAGPKRRCGVGNAREKHARPFARDPAPGLPPSCTSGAAATVLSSAHVAVMPETLVMLFLSARASLDSQRLPHSAREFTAPVFGQ